MPIPVRSSSYLPWLATTVPLASFTKHQQSHSLTVIFPHLKDPLRIGAAASAFYINDAATLFPRTVVAKARTYFAGAAADVLEVKAFFQSTLK